VSAAARGEAAEYRRRGWSPIPIKPRSKEPNLVELEPYLYRAATTEELNSWAWSGVGIVTGPLSGVLVLDVDSDEGEAFLRERGHPPTPIARTPSGGLHLYFKHPDHEEKTRIRVAPGLDVKASGGFVVAPPSVGENGKPYEWAVSPADAELADPPEWLLSILRSRRFNGPAAAVGERIPPGERNKVLASLAGTMRRRGMGEAEILAALQVANEQRCRPPLEAEEVEKIAASVARYEPAGNVVSISANGRGGAKPADYNLTDLGNAERFVRDHGENVRYCYPWAKWLVWTGSRWRRDDAGQVQRLAKETVRSIYREASGAEDEERRKALAKHATRSEGADKIKAMLELARSEVPVDPDELDADPWLLNAANGTVDLQTGEIREHRREDLITKLAPVEYDPGVSAPTWEAFLERVLPGEELRTFVQRAAGYSATGDTSEQVMLINHGAGNNGKSTFQEALSAALGDYSMRAPTEMLMARRAGGVPNDVARLKGARFVAASETEEGRRLAESLVKDLTGQDTISARFMRAEWFDFRPTHKLWLSTTSPRSAGRITPSGAGYASCRGRWPSRRQSATASSQRNSGASCPASWRGSCAGASSGGAKASRRRQRSGRPRPVTAPRWTYWATSWRTDASAASASRSAKTTSTRPTRGGLRRPARGRKPSANSACSSRSVASKTDATRSERSGSGGASGSQPSREASETGTKRGMCPGMCPGENPA
jgi:hypothetical protein